MYCSRVEENNDAWLIWHLGETNIIHYQMEMINKSEQQHFLKMTIKSHDLHYRTTSQLPMSLYFKNTCFDYEGIKELFTSFIDAIVACDRYLLNPSQLYLETSNVFYNVSNECVVLMYLPFQSKEPTSVHMSTKVFFLSLLYQHSQVSKLFEDQRIRSMVELLQSEQFDLYVFKSFLQTQRKRKINSKRKWYEFFMTKELVCELPKIEKGCSDETILMNVSDLPVLEFDHNRVEITKDTFLIGRSKELNDFSLPNALSLGRVHAEIIREASAYYIVDINTKNGTYINGQKLKSQEKYLLKIGDAVQLANEKAVFK